MNLDTHDKNALVSLSLTDEPIAVDVVRHSNRDKVIAANHGFFFSWIFFFFFFSWIFFSFLLLLLVVQT